MSDEKVTDNQKPNDELSNEDLEKVQGGAIDSYLYFEREPAPPPPPPKASK